MSAVQVLISGLDFCATVPRMLFGVHLGELPTQAHRALTELAQLREERNGQELEELRARRKEQRGCSAVEWWFGGSMLGFIPLGSGIAIADEERSVAYTAAAIDLTEEEVRDLVASGELGRPDRYSGNPVIYDSSIRQFQRGGRELTLEEAADRLSMTADDVQELVDGGQIGRRRGWGLVICEADVRTYIAEHP